MIGRNRRPVSVLTAAALLLAAGCGNLRVHVEILNPGYVDTVNLRASLFRQLQFALAEDDPTAVELGLLQQQHGLALMRAAEVQDARADEASSPLAADLERQLAQNFRSDVDQLLPEIYSRRANEIKALDSEIRKLAANWPASQEVEVESTVLGRLLLARRSQYRAAVDAGRTHIDNLAQMMSANEDSSKEFNAAAEAVAVAKATLTEVEGGQGLFDDYNAYAVVSAPKGQWASKFNETYGSGRFGSLNFAVKMEDVANFTIKGLTFDPSAVAEAAAKATTQSLVVAAQIAGVPVSLDSSQSGSGGKLADQSKALAELEASTAGWQARRQAQLDALRRIANSVLAQRDNIAGNSNDRAAAKRAIETTFQSNKALLTLPVGSAPEGT